MTVAAPEVRLGAGRPETATEVRLPEWEGPIGLLLALIESRRLDVLTVPLGALADAYLEAISRLEAERIASISAFVAVASQLILIKSRALLPRAAEPAAEGDPGDPGRDPEAELRARLLEYRAYRDAGAVLQETAIARGGLFHREPAAATAAALAGARPADGPALDPARLAEALLGIARLAPPPPPPPEVIKRTVTLNERAAILRAALRDAPVVVLQELLRGVRDRVVVAVTFLAMLELMKRREVVVEQDAPFGPIVARRTTDEERRAAGLAADVEAAPIDESMAGFA
jgi:segregation and condensation protein A